MTSRFMPDQVDLGKNLNFSVGEPINHYEKENYPNKHGYRTVMGYFLPEWQRGIVWDIDRQVRLIESIWLGMPIGTYTFNRAKEYGGKLDNLLIDGQQRMHSIECYLKDQFKVFGYYWSETTEIDKRGFRNSRHFPCYITETNDETYLKNYYNTMNFGGIAHTEGQKA